MGILQSPELAVDDIQGDVLPGFRQDGEPYVQRYLFFRVTEAARARAALAALLPRISSARDLYRASKAEPAPATAINVAFTWSGLGALDPRGEWQDEFNDHKAFKAGLRRRAKKLLGDPRKWVIDRRLHEVHLVVNVGGGDARSVQAAATAVVGVLHAEAWTCVSEHGGRTLPRGEEHFGFADGLSQPLVDGYHTVGTRPSVSALQSQPAFSYLSADDFKAERELATIMDSDFSPELQKVELKKWRRRNNRPGRRAVLRTPTPAPIFSSGGRPLLPADRFIVAALEGATESNWFTRNGSFMVWLRFVQHRDRFEKHCAEVAKDLSTAWGRRVTKADVAALEVGRRTDGTSLVKRPLFRRRPGDPPREAFAYLPDDVDGQRCPLGAHARKMNPRTIEGLERAIIRRGIPFDEAHERGLLFVCYQASIDQQYEQLQRYWANTSYGPERNGSPDPMISLAMRNGTSSMELPNREGGGSYPVTFRNDWIVPTGGLYLFVPSLSALRLLVGAAHPDG